MTTRPTNKSSEALGQAPMGNLLLTMALPASVGILVMSVNFIVDTIFIGRYVGSLGIAAITVVLPISFLISSIGMAIGIGGSSVISRALGGGDREKAEVTFGVMACMTILMAVGIVFLGSFAQKNLLELFGGRGEILTPSRQYFGILLTGIPCLAWAMMSNNIMRAQGKPRVAMVSMLIPALSNIVLDTVFIVGFGWGLEGAAWATTISYYLAAGYTLWFFLLGDSEMRLHWKTLVLRWQIVKEIASIGLVTLARQGTISLLSIVLNNSLFSHGGEMAVAVYGVISRVMMFANFPVLGITQGFLPIAGYNYGARKWQRVKESITTSVKVGTGVALIIFTCILIFSGPLVGLFSQDPLLLGITPPALVIAFLATPLITAQLVGSAYFQAIGKSLPALLLTLTKQGFFLIPLIMILPVFMGLNGIWWSFPIADVMAATVTLWYLKREITLRINPQLKAEKAEEAKLAAEKASTITAY